MSFKLPDLEYSFDSLEPEIDAKTMEIHHDKHHAGYVNKLNTALEGTDFENKEIEELLRNIDDVPEDIRQSVINNGGGHANHSLFWQIMTPDEEKREFKGKIAEEIESKWESFDSFKEKFKSTALERFGSGWVWLVLGSDGLEIMSTANQDSPLMSGLKPILGLDVWEHAYYLNYQNKRDEYVDSFFKVINWDKVNELHEGII